MTTTYIQFDNPKSGTETLNDGLIKSTFKKILIKILTLVIPKANPDFEDKIDEVKYWLVECETETGIPQREIGLDEQGRLILKMPYKNNYGFWTDNNLLLADFKEHFTVSEISKESFESNWELFDKLTEIEIEVEKYKILTTGADGGRIYLITEIEYLNQKRTLAIYFANNLEEQKIKAIKKIKLSGQLLDDGIHQSLSLLDTKFID